MERSMDTLFTALWIASRKPTTALATEASPASSSGLLRLLAAFAVIAGIVGLLENAVSGYVPDVAVASSVLQKGTAQ
jgi:hypothetical protein